MTTAIIKVLLSHLLRISLDIVLTVANTSFGCLATPFYFVHLKYTTKPKVCQQFIKVIYKYFASISLTEPMINPRIIKYVCFGYFSIKCSNNLLRESTPTTTPNPSGIKKVNWIFLTASNSDSYNPRINKK